MILRPLQDRILVRMDPLDPEFDESGLVRPDIAKDAPMWGTVEGAGPGRYAQIRGRTVFRPVTVRRGERVMIPCDIGQPMRRAGVTYRLIREHGPDGDGRGGILATEAVQ